MNALSPNLLDTDFKQLVELARMRVPKWAPDWTDHNLHDPGVMLIELLAWITEAQIYSLARVRNDERWAFGALFGLQPHGPVPATGMAWPAHGSSGAALLAPCDSLLDTGAPNMPAFRLRTAINLTGAKLTGVESRLHDGSVLDHTVANGRREGSFYPFGPASHPDDRLVLSFEGELLAPRADGRSCLAIGVRVEPMTTTSATGPTQSACIRALLVDGHRSFSLPVQKDDSEGFTRSGVLLLGLRHVPDQLTDFSIVFSADGFAAAPRIVCVQPNVLPMEQSQPSFQDLISNGLPDQFIDLERSGIRYPDGQLEVTVQQKQETSTWKSCTDMTQAEPDASVYQFDAQRARILFGNGVNGRIAPEGATIKVTYQVSGGATGNLVAGHTWILRGGAGHRFENLERTTGGAPALELDQLRRLARAKVREAHPIVTARDLEGAAMQLPALKVARAHSLAATACGASGVPSDWVLIALREPQAANAPAGLRESRRWLEHVRRALAPRVLLGERLRVQAPDYVSVRIEVTLILRQGVDPAEVKRLALALLTSYFKLVDAAGGPVWPLGRPLRVLDLKGRLLRLDGVTSVPACSLFAAGLTVAQEVVTLKPTGLPQFEPERSVLTLTSGGARA